MTSTTQAVEDITALALAYNASAGARDSAAQAATYTADGEFHAEALGTALVGREAIAEFLRTGHSRVDFLHLDGTVSDIVLDGDRATAVTHIMEHTKGAGAGPYVLVFADFDEELRREDDRWLFSRRTMRVKRFVRLEDQPYAVAEQEGPVDDVRLDERRALRAASAATSIEDATEIRTLANTYSAHAAARDPDGQAHTFTADGEFAGITSLSRGGDGATLVGRAAIAEFLGGTHTRVDLLHHHSTVADIVVDGDRATAKTQLTEHTQGKGGGPFVVLFADCADEFAKEDGRWLFSRRTIELKRLTAFASSPFG